METTRAGSVTMASPREVIHLIERFEPNRDVYRSHNYNETEARREFIDPFFKAFGWDIDNKQGYAQARILYNRRAHVRE